MATPTTFVRDWVFNVVAPFLTQLKNRLANIRLELDLPRNKLKFYNAENELTEIERHPPRHNGVHTIYPRFARRSVSSATLEGYLVIMLPESVHINTMMSIYLDVFVYKGNQSFSCLLAGYNYQSPRWVNTTAREISRVPTDKDKVKFVRFLKDGGDANNDADYTRFGFIIGDNEDAKWPYPKVSISKVVLGHQWTGIAYDIDNYGWYIDWHDDSDMPSYKKDITRTM